MKTLRNRLQSNAMTLYWVAAIILHVTLFSYAGERAGVANQEEERISPIQTSDYSEWYKGFLATNSFEPFSQVIVSRFNDGEGWAWANGFIILAIFVLGSAFWQASTRMRQENEYLLSGNESTCSWRTDSLLLTYLTLLVLQIGLTAIISFTPVSVYTFWIGYASVLLGQLTPAGQRIGVGLLRTFEPLFKPADRAFR